MKLSLSKKKPLVKLVLLFFLSIFEIVHAQDITFIGNSLTFHGPKASIDWNGEWGMAASSLDKDYVHILNKKLVIKQFDIIPGISLEQTFEKEANVYSFAKKIKDDQKLIILEIGDNINYKLINDATFDSHYKNLANLLQKKLRKDGKLICLTNWWPKPNIDKIIINICSGKQISSIYLGDISKNAWAKASSERNIANDGVGNHPGDKAMSEIADSIYKEAIK